MYAASIASAPAGTETYHFVTLAGNRSDDGTGIDAGFKLPSGVVVDSAGNAYVTDWGNSTIRKVTPAGEVSTLAGLAGNWGSADGTGSNARFGDLYGGAVDSEGSIYVADESNDIIRKITAAGVVITIAGRAGVRAVLTELTGDSTVHRVLHWTALGMSTWRTGATQRSGGSRGLV